MTPATLEYLLALVREAWPGDRVSFTDLGDGTACLAVCWGTAPAPSEVRAVERWLCVAPAADALVAALKAAPGRVGMRPIDRIVVRLLEGCPEAHYMLAARRVTGLARGGLVVFFPSTRTAQVRRDAVTGDVLGLGPLAGRGWPERLVDAALEAAGWVSLAPPAARAEDGAEVTP